MEPNKKSLIVLSSPSGGGKTTIARNILQKYIEIKFAVSATTRPKRPREIEGKDYFFLTKEHFKQRIEKSEFVEYEEIFGNFYGTLKSEVDNVLFKNKKMIFDVDVKGALSIQKIYPYHSILIFIMPPNIEELKNRLKRRSTESDEQINKRIERAEMEMMQKHLFDFVVINDNLEKAISEVEKIILENT